METRPITKPVLNSILRNQFLNHFKIANDYSLMGESFQDYSWIQVFEADFP